METVDLLIVGAGIAGLYVGLEWLKKNPDSRCILLEKYGYTGGRIVTYHTSVRGRGRLQWEGGAGRIPTSHHRVRALLRRYELTFVPISRTWGYSYPVQPNPFTAWTDGYLPPLSRLAPSVLRGTTLSTLLRRVYGPARTRAYLSSFPYFSEFHTLRADLALQALQGELRSPASFGVCAEGLSELMNRMEQEFVGRGGVLRHECPVDHVEVHARPLCVRAMHTPSQTRHEYRAHRVVLAMDAVSLRHLRGVSSLPVLSRLHMEPLLRIYAVFPIRQGKSWFSDIGTLVTDSPIRFFIPVQPDKGVAMISYTEGDDARRWMNMKPLERHRVVMDELRRLFAPLPIPDPLFIHSHPWKTGCTYWLPGNYDPAVESEASVQPWPEHPLYLCSESFAVMQSWMESALVQAEKVVARLE